MLSKFGVPAHLLSLIKRIHTGVVAKFKMGTEEVEIPNTSGTKQGDPLAAILFLFHIQACLETLDVEGLSFRTAAAGVEGTKGRGLTGSKGIRRSEGFSVAMSLYADDAGNLFETRAKLHEGLRKIFAHFKRFGLTMHVGRNGAASKTEAMFFPGAGHSYEDGDTSPMEVDGGTVTFTKSFVYLGSTLASSLTSNPDLEARLSKASQVFGALRGPVFATRDISLRTKAKVYRGLVLSVLLYGSECWAPLARDKAKLERFHRRCVRTMTGTSRRKQWKRHITSINLENRMGLESLEYYLRTRTLRWVGHLVRMPYERLPRKLLFSWIRHPRKSGGQTLTYGRHVNTLLRQATQLAPPDVRYDLTPGGAAGWAELPNAPPPMGWIELAHDRTRWRQLAKAGQRFKPKATAHRQRRRAQRTPAPATPAVMPTAPDGVPAYMSSAYINWFDRLPAWMYGCYRPPQMYARFIDEWTPS